MSDLRSICGEVPPEVFEDLDDYRRRRRTTWAGVLVDARDQLVEEIEEVPAK